jgi:hypothetical protein
MTLGICPVCNGTCRRPAGDDQYKHMYMGYDKDNDTLPCNNCGGQTMYGRATGQVPLRADGTPCVHEYDYKLLGRCYHGYTCRHCSFKYEIDSGD